MYSSDDRGGISGTFLYGNREHTGVEPGSQDETELYALDAAEICMGDIGGKIYIGNPADADCVWHFRNCNRDQQHGCSAEDRRTCGSCADGAGTIWSVYKRRAALDGSGLSCICYLPELDAGDHDRVSGGHTGQNTADQIKICRRTCGDFFLCY